MLREHSYFSAVLVLSLFAASWACSCFLLSKEKLLCDAKYVIAGRVAAKACRDRFNDDDFCYTHIYDVEAIAVYRREDGGELIEVDIDAENMRTIQVATASSSAACGVNLRLGKNVIFTTYNNATFRLEINLCATVIEYNPTQERIEEFIREAQQSCSTDLMFEGLL